MIPRMRAYAKIGDIGKKSDNIIPEYSGPFACGSPDGGGGISRRSSPSISTAHGQCRLLGLPRPSRVPCLPTQSPGARGHPPNTTHDHPASKQHLLQGARTAPEPVTGGHGSEQTPTPPSRLRPCASPVSSSLPCSPTVKRHFLRTWIFSERRGEKERECC